MVSDPWESGGEAGGPGCRWFEPATMNPGWKQYLKGNTVLTPHMGEMGRLTGLSISELKEDPVGAASDYAKETGAVCVLKDAGTVTAGCRDEIYINMSGNAGMAAAGSGDVLSGMLAGVFCMISEQYKGTGSGKDGSSWRVSPWTMWRQGGRCCWYKRDECPQYPGCDPTGTSGF